MFRKFFWVRLVGALILIGLLFGVGAISYRAGLAQGVAQAPEVAQAIAQAAEKGQAAPIPPMMVRGYGYGYPFGYGYPHPFGFFPFGAICGSLFLLFFFFGALRMVFFHPGRMGWGHYSAHAHGPHGHPWGGPPWMRPEGDEEQKKEEPTTENK